MFANNKKAIIKINRIMIIGIIGLIVGSLFDMPINKSLYWRGSIIPNFVRLCGEMPMIILLNAISIATIRETLLRFNKIEDKSKYITVFLAVLSIILPTINSSFGIPVYFGWEELWKTALIVIFYLIISYGFSFIFKNTNYKILLRYFYLVVFVVTISMLVLSLAKNFWSRARFHNMMEKNDFSEFSFWLIPQMRENVTDAYKSFPSGHTTSATVALLLLFIPKTSYNEKYLKYTKIFAIVWPLLVALGRIFDGAHFLTDVSMGLILSCIVIKIAIKVQNSLLKKDGILA